MKFLLDVHISRHIAQVLTDAGHHVARAALLWPTASDATLLETAIAEQRIVITQDSDFSDLIFAHGHPAPLALLYIRCPPTEQPTIVDHLLAAIDDKPLLGHLVVVTTRENRHRPFPKRDHG